MNRRFQHLFSLSWAKARRLSRGADEPGPRLWRLPPERLRRSGSAPAATIHPNRWSTSSVRRFARWVTSGPLRHRCPICSGLRRLRRRCLICFPAMVRCWNSKIQAGSGRRRLHCRHRPHQGHRTFRLRENFPQRRGSCGDGPARFRLHSAEGWAIPACSWG